MRDTSDLRRLLDVSRAVTLCGAGGVGKTRLAIQVARDSSRDYNDVRFVELADADRADQLVPRLAVVADIRPEPGHPLEQTVLAALAEQRILLVLDNCEHLIAECARLADLLLGTCPRLTLLATSREPLRVPGELVWRVPPLAVPDPDVRDPAQIRGYEAVALFEQRAAATRPGFQVTAENAAAVADVCRAVDGIPLALELSAARVGMMSVAQILDRLSDRFHVLTAGDRTAPERQRTLRATIDWSYRLLDERERVLLRRLAIFQNGWTLPMAEQVCADPEVPVSRFLDAFAGLIDKSFVVPKEERGGAMRYRMMESIRDYALEHLTTCGEASALRAAMGDYLLGLAERWDDQFTHASGSWEQRLEACHELAAEHENLLAVLAWTVEAGQTERGLRLSGALRAHWAHRDDKAEGASWTKSLLDRADATTDQRVLARALSAYATICYPLGEFTEAAEAGRSAMALGRALDEPGLKAQAAIPLGAALWQSGEEARGLEVLLDAVRLSQVSGDRVNEALSYAALGTVTGQQGQLKQAQRHLEQATALMRQLDHRWGVATSLLGLATLAEHRADHGTAARLYCEALTAAEGMDMAQERLRGMIGYGRCLAAQANHAAAREVLLDALHHSRAAGQRLHVARILEIFASMALRNAAPARAVQLMAAAQAIRDPLKRVRAAGSGAQLDNLRSRAELMIGATTVSRLWAEGSALTLDEAFALAVDTSAELPADDIRPAADASPVGSVLTAREREIAALLTRGLTNRAIAAELVISEATVARHVANILTKLGFTSRTQVAAWFMQH
ncbi:ATP-binding protein [Nonomuraea sp. NPDC050556]|uniref:ATP-binding protein n=1 Tax=Nonomuraea sp. NPDC050556 TaxID=3364369 RepID=UPI00378BD87B